ncbi:MAG: nucleotide exchange factor GrpE [Nitrospirota bacterium]|nr:nucleotide exchange factor GrpE [Nitrospirota bacterium]
MEPTEKQEQNEIAPGVNLVDGLPDLNAQAQEPELLESDDAAGPPAHEESPIEKELNIKTEECQVLNEKYLRLAAEFENYKRRAQRDQSDTVRFGNEKTLKDLLPTIDNLERAIQCGQEQSSNIEAVLQGVQLTHKQLLDTLSKLGVSQISSIGELFDPAKHQAVANVESPTVPEQHVVDEYQKGYFLHERILRPAMVTVSTAPSEECMPDENDRSE